MLLYFSDKDYQPQTLDEISRVLKAKGSRKNILKKLLHDLEKSGQIRQDQNRRYQRNYLLRKPSSKDPNHNYHQLNKKQVRKGKAYGSHRRSNPPVVNPIIGTLFRIRKDVYEIVPLRKRIPISFRFNDTSQIPSNPRDTDIFLLHLEKKKGKRTGPYYASKIQALGNISDPFIDTPLVLSELQIEAHFPREVVKASKDLPIEDHFNAQDDRVDLRELPFVTIDGEDARDFDDAVCINAQGQLCIAIADVAHYVAANSILDEEAASRGNSFYFPDQVVPMFPEKISNYLCSLRPQEDKRAMVLIIDFDNDGQVNKVKIQEAWIRSQARLTYTQVQKLLSQQKEPNIPATLEKMLRQLAKRTLDLRKKRMKNGSIHFDLSDIRSSTNAAGEITSIERSHQSQAQQLIEDCMLLANVCIAEFLQEHFDEIIFRVHPPPSETKLFEFAHLLGAYGIEIDDPLLLGQSEFLNQTLERITQLPNGEYLLPWGLRAMEQAYYSIENRGHYALAFPDYLHFTSPIRRYADLVNHRLVKKVISGNEPESVFPKRFQSMENVCTHISQQERLAIDAERKVRHRKSCRYLNGRQGEQQLATVMGMNPRGLFMELTEEPIEGFLPLFYFRKDRLVYYEEDKIFVSRNRGHEIRLGDQFEIVIDKVDILNAYIDFKPAGDPFR